MKRIALLLLASPLVLAACGGGSPSAHMNVDPVAYVKHAAKKTAQTSEHMTMNATMDMGPMSVTLNGSGDFSFEQHVGQLSASASIMGQNIKVQEIIAGTSIYMSSPMFASSLPAGKKWMKIDLAQIGKKHGIDISSLMSQSPSDSLTKLEAAGTVTEVGSETIDGDATTHYRVEHLDLSKLPGGAKLSHLGTFKYGPIDVWIGDSNGYVYRETMTFDGSSAGHSVTMTMTANLSKFGEDVHVTVPSDSDTFDATQLALPGLG